MSAVGKNEVKYGRTFSDRLQIYVQSSYCTADKMNEKRTEIQSSTDCSEN